MFGRKERMLRNLIPGFLAFVLCLSFGISHADEVAPPQDELGAQIRKLQKQRPEIKEFMKAMVVRKLAVNMTLIMREKGLSEPEIQEVLHRVTKILKAK